MRERPIALRGSPYCLPPRPARPMSRRGLALVWGIYAVLFGGAALRLALGG